MKRRKLGRNALANQLSGRGEKALALSTNVSRKEEVEILLRSRNFKPKLLTASRCFAEPIADISAIRRL